MNNPDIKRVVLCPTCEKIVIWSEQEKFRPFCSERCKLIDLGEWAAEEKIIPGETGTVNPDFSADTFLH